MRGRRAIRITVVAVIAALSAGCASTKPVAGSSTATTAPASTVAPTTTETTINPAVSQAEATVASDQNLVNQAEAKQQADQATESADNTQCDTAESLVASHLSDPAYTAQATTICNKVIQDDGVLAADTSAISQASVNLAQAKATLQVLEDEG